jgi:hypothetical protein
MQWCHPPFRLIKNSWCHCYVIMFNPVGHNVSLATVPTPFQRTHNNHFDDAWKDNLSSSYTDWFLWDLSWKSDSNFLSQGFSPKGHQWYTLKTAVLLIWKPLCHSLNVINVKQYPVLRWVTNSSLSTKFRRVVSWSIAIRWSQKSRERIAFTN